MSTRTLTDAIAVSWDELCFTEVRPGISGATLETAQLTATVYRYTPGSSWETHRHADDQVTFVHSGGPVQFVIADEPVELSAGQIAVIPGGLPHSARISADAELAITVNVWRLRSRGRC